MARLSQSSINRQTHIPAHIQQAMNQHMQNTMPSHLRGYTGGSYVPRHAEKAISEHMQKTMPAHLQQYAGAYMEQNILNPTAAAPNASSAALKPRPPVPNQVRLDHSNVSAEQFGANFHDNLFAADPSPGSAVQPQATANETPGQTPQPEAPNPDPQSSGYEFITDPVKPPQHSFNLLPGNASLAKRLVIVLGGLLVLIILFSVIKGFLSGGSNTPALVDVAQDQQEMIHLATAASQQSQQQTALSTTNQNFAVTTQLSMTSAQSELVAYLKNNGKKVNEKTLGVKISPATDTQLTTAASNSTYDATFKQIMQDKLKDYQTALRQAYNQTSGPKGRKLLSQDFNGAQLLIQQLNSPAS